MEDLQYKVIHFKGFKVELTGEVEAYSGGLFAVGGWLEGPNKGKLVHVSLTHSELGHVDQASKLRQLARGA